MFLMDKFSYNKEQSALIDSPIASSIFLSGPYGSGKTTAAIGRINKILEISPGYKILIITPQQSLSIPYKDFFARNSKVIGSLPTITTFNGLSRSLIRKFWPLISSEMGFRLPEKPPIFLSLESAQYCLSKIVDPLIDTGYFQTVTVERNRLFSQILDNLNKTALADIPIDEIAPRLKMSAVENSTMHLAFEQAQECAIKFRTYCLENNLIDFSLNVSLFRKHVWPIDFCRNYIQARYGALIVDNLEEDTPFAHELIKDLVKMVESSLLIFDDEGGFRSFLGADSNGAKIINNACEIKHRFSKEFVTSDELLNFRIGLGACITRENITSIKYKIPKNSDLSFYRFYPEMISDTCLKIKELLDNGESPEEIVVLSPYLSDSLKFSLTETLKSMHILFRTSRPSRMYLDSSEARAMIILAKIAHPDWNMKVSFFEFRNLIMRIIPNLDIVRADLIAKHLFNSENAAYSIRSFDKIKEISLQERITFQTGEKIEILRRWLLDYQNEEPNPLDIFFQEIYGQVLSQRGFHFHDDFDAANLISKLIQSTRSFRNFSQEAFSYNSKSIGKEYIQTIEFGLIPSSFPNSSGDESGVLIAPAHTFLMENRSSAYQFWLDIGSLGWWERLYQPLTNPYIFRPQWKSNEAWTNQKDYLTNQQSMHRLVTGLLSRCSKSVHAASVQVNEYGSENHGPLLQAFQTYLKRNQRLGKGNHV
jgi:hypothetical protein